MNTQLAAVRLDRPLTAAEGTALTSLLPPERRARFERTCQKKQPEILAAYGLAFLLLRRACGWAEFPEPGLSPRGKPFFPACPTLHFSLSHTDGAAAAGISSAEVGIDIERLRQIPPSLLGRYGADSSRAFLDSWVRREALAKRQDRGSALLVPEEPKPEPGERAVLLPVFSGYTAAAAWSAGFEPEPLQIWTMEELAAAAAI